MDVHVRDLRYFIAVAEELHFRKAAERLFVSQPVLSRQIARLETMVQARLLERDHRLVRLTPAGEYLLERARMLLAEWDETGAELARLGKLHASTLIVGLQTGVGRGLTGRLAAGLREVGWQLEARNIPWSDPLAGVGTKECDAGFAWLGATTDPQCAHVVVAEEPIMLAVSSDHWLATRPEVTFADIAQEALVALPAEAGVLRSFWLAEHARDDTCPATVSCLSTTADAALENVAAGRGSVLLAAGNAQLYGREGLCFLPVVDLPPARLAFLWRAADDRSIIAHAARIMGDASGDAFSL